MSEYFSATSEMREWKSDLSLQARTRVSREKFLALDSLTSDL